MVFALECCDCSRKGELLTALPDSGSSPRKGVEVRVLFSALTQSAGQARWLRFLFRPWNSATCFVLCPSETLSFVLLHIRMPGWRAKCEMRVPLHRDVNLMQYSTVVTSRVFDKQRAYQTKEPPRARISLA